MIDNVIMVDIQQAVTEIPVEYQEMFRATIEQKMREKGDLHDDTAILNYLRGWRDDFKRGSFVRPDGRIGYVALDSDAIYENGMPLLVQQLAGKGVNSAEKRRTRLKIAAFGLATLLLFLVALRGRAARSAQADETPAATLATSTVPMAIPTQPLPDVTGADETLKTVGGLGGALTIGRPSSLELHYAATESIIALPIDPSKTTAKGELRYNESVMRSDNPVAVWLFGTVLNYAIGIPNSMVRNLQNGDRVTLNNDTGAALHFIVTEQSDAASHQTGELLSQDHIGLTLFALPASTEDGVAYAIARYDVAREAESAERIYTQSDTLILENATTLTIAAVQFSHDTTGQLTVEISGTTTSDQPLLLSLLLGSEQTAVQTVTNAESNHWQAIFVLSEQAVGKPLFAEFRTASNTLYTVSLNQVPNLLSRLNVSVHAAQWDKSQDAAVLTIPVHNPTADAIYLPSGFVQLTQGGDANAPIGQLNPVLPIHLSSGESLTLTLTAYPSIHSMRLQLGADLYDISNIPVEP